MKANFGWLRCLWQRWDDFESYFEVAEYVWWNTWSLAVVGGVRLFTEDLADLQHEPTAASLQHIGLLTEHELTRVLQMLDAIQRKMGIDDDRASEPAETIRGYLGESGLVGREAECGNGDQHKETFKARPSA